MSLAGHPLGDATGDGARGPEKSFRHCLVTLLAQRGTSRYKSGWFLIEPPLCAYLRRGIRLERRPIVPFLSGTCPSGLAYGVLFSEPNPYTARERKEQSMALVEDLWSDWGWGTTGLVGLGALVVAPGLVSTLGRVVRPAAKGVIWGALALTEGLREVVAEAGERVSGRHSEARHEYEQNRSATAASVATAASRIITPEASPAAPASPLLTPEGKPVTDRAEAHHESEQTRSATATSAATA